jgi:GntR family transcriptional regulator
VAEDDHDRDVPLIDRDSEIPPYQQIADMLAERIRSGELEPRRPIPSETTLMQMYEAERVARTTIRRAIARLREQGLVYTVPQRGTYVTPPEER